ncbi:MAG: hypothetical protein IJT58_02395 [Synergistaceae bacterium]|nr:hypothetical protein [Synergistaceae bacterium]
MDLSRKGGDFHGVQQALAKSAKKSSYVAGCPTHSPHEWGGKSTCVKCEVVK